MLFRSLSDPYPWYNMDSMLQTVLTKIIAIKPQSREAFNAARQRTCGELKITPPSNRKLLEAYQLLVKNKTLTRDTQFEQFLCKANIRSMSGIAVITSLVKPYNCPGKCIYCPTEVRMPKSYIASEPAAARALRLDFSPYEQMRRRIEMLESNGHPVEKIEYIIKGGTWNAYPIKYQYWFILESFKACNDLARKNNKKKIRAQTLTESSPLNELQKALEKEQRYNEQTTYRIIGLTLETRPDAINPKTIVHMRQQGCTRIELGLQAPDDAILALVKRGHTVQQFRDAMFLLRQAGFKVDIHFMPDLPGTTPEHDVEMYHSLFTDEGLKPDMVKIYPNTVIPSAELFQWLKDGRFKPYGNEKLFSALLQMKLATPRYCRISRLIRDIPSDEIAAGNTITNLRENLSAELTKQKKICLCLRCREIGRHIKEVQPDTVPVLFTESYETIGGKEYFLTLEDPKRIAVYAFLRLRIPQKKAPSLLYKLMQEIQDCTFIRELHTYGQLVRVGKQDSRGSQHKGLGKQLMKEAERLSKKEKYDKVLVISGVGVRGYYRKLGYRKMGTYMGKKI